MILKIICLFLYCLFSLGFAWSNCGSDGLKITSVFMKHCHNSPSPIKPDMCWPKKNANNTLFVVFTPYKNYTNLTVSVHTDLGVKFPLFDNGLVTCSRKPCSLIEGVAVKTHFSFMLNEKLPDSRPVKTYWYFMDDKEAIAGCFQITFMISE
uniref:MD-2-related lipid-recognition domain-containing protein n=1 Tax=Amphimedon queenslandica TaxID=400682 RepID=A0A1X7UVY9_AMPQE